MDAATLLFSILQQPKGMKLKFFLPKPKGTIPSAAPFLSVRTKGQVSFSHAAITATNAEQGESATICFDEEAQRWLLAHWPNGQEGQPQLRATSGKGKGLRFQCTAVAEPLFAAVPHHKEGSLCLALDTAALTSPEAPGATLYVLSLPLSEPASVKQPGVGRGNYNRAAKKGGSRG